MTVASGEINLQSKHDLICHLSKVKAATSTHSMADVIPFLENKILLIFYFNYLFFFRTKSSSIFVTQCVVVVIVVVGSYIVYWCCTFA